MSKRFKPLIASQISHLAKTYNFLLKNHFEFYKRRCCKQTIKVLIKKHMIYGKREMFIF